ncbi:MAG: GAF domain-containing protein [Chloroflexi bacterium]|nr:GAF domain-containing protein [Chloroflexota bacterium]
MSSDKTRPTTIHDQILALGLQAARLRDALQKKKARDLPPNTVEDLTNLTNTLNNVGLQIESFEAEHSKLMAGFLMLRDESGQMSTRMARNWEQESIKSNEAATSRTIVQRVIESGQPVITTNAQEDQRFSGQESIMALNLRSILCVPLKVKNDLIGVIYADNRIRAGIFAETERDLLAALANQAAVAIENARLFSSLRHTLAEVTELKNLMDNVFSSIASGVITADIGNQITLANRAAQSILGRASTEIVGHQLDEALASVSKELQPHLAEVRQTDKPIVDLEISHKSSNGGSVDWRFNLSPLKDAGQKTQGLAIVLDDMTERKKLEAQRRLLERMVSPAVLDQIDPNSLQIGGKKADITILFADIRGFTSYSERQSPEKLVAVLNRYLAAAAEAVLEHEGTVDKFLGDAIMAWYNAPIAQPDHTLRAVKTALSIRDAIAKLHAELPEEAHLDFGVGIHYGEAVLGWIGTEKRLEFTAIGDSINSTKRIQENASKNQILISNEAYARVEKWVDAKPYAPLVVKGKSQPIDVLEVTGLK